jgi:type II secretory pathway predicted ATPase ExeA
MLRDRPQFPAPPFDGAPEPASFHAGLPQEEALARIEWLCGHRERCGIVLGAAGVGKSHLAALAARRLAGLGAEVAVLSVGGLPEGEWLELLLDRLPLDQRSRAEPGRAWQKLENRLRENTLLERTTALVFDDADRAPADAVEGIARLAAAVEPRFSRTLIVVTARPEGLARLPDELRDRAAVRIELAPWEEHDVAAFIASALQRAGGDPGLFSVEAVETMARFTGGMPRQVVRLARLALAAAAGDGLGTVDAATVERAWRELMPVERPVAAAAEVRGTGDPDRPATVRVVRRLGG